MKKPNKNKAQIRKTMEGKGLAVQHKIASMAERLTKTTHFTLAECKALVHLHHNLEMAAGKLSRMRMREVLHIVFEITDDIMLDLAFKAFDRDNDGHVDESEWVQGISTMMRGTTEELSDWCYYIYDLNGDGGLAREELTYCLKGCMYPGYGIDADELEECERDIVEIVMRKLDLEREGQITRANFKRACRNDPLLMVTVGPCLPPLKSCAAFLSLITENFRNYTGPLGRTVDKKNRPSSHGHGGHFSLPTSTMFELSETPSSVDNNRETKQKHPTEWNEQV